jgi:hypothetical protein
VIARLALAAVLLASMPATSAAASCHRYAVWHYRFPQRCYAARPASVRHIAYATIPQKREFVQVQHPAASPPLADDHSWYVDITKMPPLDDAIGRALGVEELKRKLEGQ